jgi:thiol-disulfide isomerase/thioredoxin
MATKTSLSKRERAEARARAERRSRILTVVALGVVGVALMAIVTASFTGGADAPTGITETTAWELPELDGDGRITLADFEGTPTVAAFFASWCAVCVDELPQFAAVSDIVGDQVDFVGIDTMDNGTGLGLAQRTGIADRWPLARDVGGIDGRGLATAFGAQGSPMTVIYSPTGEPLDVIRGGISGQALIDRLVNLFDIDV